MIKNTLILLYTITFAVSILLGVFIRLNNNSVNEQNTPVKKEPSNLSAPVPEKVLVSSLVRTLYANIEGNIIEKTNDYMVIRKDEQNIKIFIEENSGATTFKQKTANGQYKNIFYKDVKEGSYVSGGINIAYAQFEQGGSRKYKSGDIIGHAFEITAGNE